MQTRSREDVRLVVVEDHEDTRIALQQLLERDGYHVRSACDGHEAIAVIEEHKPVCVLLDLCMPRLDGVELARHVRQRYGTGTVLIVLTGSTCQEDLEAVESAGADFVLHKPLEPAALSRLLPPIA
jgi:CheY-like chemotaxis protein